MTNTVSRFEAVKENVSLRAYAEAELEHTSDGKLICPICHSGTGPKRTPAFSITQDGEHWHCFSCQNGGDVFDLIGAVKGTNDKTEQLKAAEEWADGTGDLRLEARQRAILGKPGKVKPSYSSGRAKERAYIEECRENMAAEGNPGESYLQARGFTRAEIIAAGIGYDPVRRRVVIPFSADPLEWYHIDRDVTGEAAHKYEKPKASDVGPQPVHNVRALEGGVVVVVEGILDAMAVEACGYPAIALCGTGYRGLLNAMVEKGYEGVALLMFDGDSAGHAAQLKMIDELEGAGIGYATASLGLFKDAADALKADRMALKDILDTKVSRARELAQSASESRYRAAMEHMRAIDPANTVIDIFTLSTCEEPTPTGLSGLDRALDGGLRTGVYVLGAISSLGKTTLTVQIADSVAAAGRGVLFVTIEQSAEEIVSKSLSRIMKQRGGVCATTRMITSRSTREAWADGGEMHEALEAACTEYTDKIAPNMRILEGTEQPRVQDIAAVAQAMADHYGHAPVVFIDYLQLLAPQSDRDTDKQAIDRNMMSLRHLARDLRTTVFVISSLNRSSYSGTVSLDSFKESGGIEYGADVLLGLQPRNMAEQLEDVSEARRKAEAAKLMRRHKASAERPSEIVVLKQRSGSTPDGGVPLTFLPACSMFVESGQGRPGVRII